jgi:hypothetical protein
MPEADRLTAADRPRRRLAMTPSRADPVGSARALPSGPQPVAVEPVGRPDVSARLTALVLLLLTGVGAFLRFAGIGDKSLWIDEAFSVWVSDQPVGDLWRTTVELDFHPPLYYGALHVWVGFGDGEAALRSLSALLSVLTLPVVFLIGERLGGPVLGLLSCGLVALSPLQISYAQQARMYALMTFCASLSILFLVLVLDGTAGGRTARRRTLYWACFAVSTTSTMLSHNTGVLLAAAVALFVAIVMVRSVRRRARGHVDPLLPSGSLRQPLQGVVGAATGLGAALVLWLPWLPHFVSQSRRVDDEFWISAPSLPTFLQHWEDLFNAYGPEAGRGIYVLIGVVVLIVLGVGQLRAPMALLLVLLVLVPVALELLVSIRRPIFFTQTLVWTAIPFSVLMAAAMLRLRIRPLIILVAGGVVLLNAVAIRSYYLDGSKEDWRTAAQYVAQGVRTGDLVLFSAAWAQIPFDYYYDRYGGPSIREHGLPTDVEESRVLEAKMTQADVARLDELTARSPTVWLVYSHDWYTDPGGIVPSRLSSSFEQVESRVLTGVTVTRYRAGSD